MLVLNDAIILAENHLEGARLFLAVPATDPAIRQFLSGGGTMFSIRWEDTGERDVFTFNGIIRGEAIFGRRLWTEDSEDRPSMPEARLLSGRRREGNGSQP